MADQKTQRNVVRRQVVRIVVDVRGWEQISVDDVPPNMVVGPPVFEADGTLKNPGMKADEQLRKIMRVELGAYISTHKGKKGLPKGQPEGDTTLSDLVQIVWDLLP